MLCKPGLKITKLRVKDNKLNLLLIVGEGSPAFFQDGLFSMPHREGHSLKGPPSINVNECDKVVPNPGIEQKTSLVFSFCTIAQ